MIIQVGPYPPPVGGISIYIQRLKDLLDSKDIDNQVWDYSTIKKTEKNVKNIRLIFVPFYNIFKRDVDLIHYNICGMNTKRYIAFFNRVFFKKRKKIITLHGDCTALTDKETKQLIKYLHNFDATICLKSEDKKHLIDHGLSTDLYVIPAFFPPIVNKVDAVRIPQEVNDFIDTHQPVLSANASQLIFVNGQDRYGLDMCIDLCLSLKKDYPKIGFIFCIADISNEQYFDTMKQKIVDDGIEDNFLFITDSSPLYPIIMKSNVFVRPSDTDGDAVSVREALYFKVPTVASDAVLRPQGVVIFKNRDIQDFIDKIRDVLQNSQMYKKKLEDVKQPDNFEKIIQVYQKYTDV